MINIAKGKTDWNTIRAEYVSGESIRSLSEKYSLNKSTICRKSVSEGWEDLRAKAADRTRIKSVQKIAEAASDNATIAARIKAKLLRKLEREIDALPDMIGSETRNSVTEMDTGKGKRTQKEVMKAYKLRDLAAAYKDLTADMVTTETAVNPLLQSLYDLERRCQGD